MSKCLILNLEHQDDVVEESRTLSALRKSYFYCKPWKSVPSIIDNDKNHFQVHLDVQEFNPEDITVTVRANGTITIKGRHARTPIGNALVTKRFIRKYTLLRGCNVDLITAVLSADAVLTVTAPKMDIEVKYDRVIPVLKL